MRSSASQWRCCTQIPAAQHIPLSASGKHLLYGAAYSGCVVDVAHVHALVASDSAARSDAEVAARRLCSPGFAPDAKVSTYLKLLPMLAGIGSPGTLQEVRRCSTGARCSILWAPLTLAQQSALM